MPELLLLPFSSPLEGEELKVRGHKFLKPSPIKGEGREGVSVTSVIYLVWLLGIRDI
jgi:hypothetical protein